MSPDLVSENGSEAEGLGKAMLETLGPPYDVTALHQVFRVLTNLINPNQSDRNTRWVHSSVHARCFHAQLSFHSNCYACHVCCCSSCLLASVPPWLPSAKICSHTRVSLAFVLFVDILVCPLCVVVVHLTECEADSYGGWSSRCCLSCFFAFLSSCSRYRELGLRLINVALETAGQHLGSHACLVEEVQDQLCRHLLTNSQVSQCALASSSYTVFSMAVCSFCCCLLGSGAHMCTHRQ